MPFFQRVAQFLHASVPQSVFQNVLTEFNYNNLTPKKLFYPTLTFGCTAQLEAT